MTDTKTCRGVKSLLALLLTGMALLMMGAARPVLAQTASATITNFTVTPEGSADITGDELAYGAQGIWTGPGDAPWDITLYVTYYSGTTPGVTISHLTPYGGDGTSSVDTIAGDVHFRGWYFCHSLFNPNTQTGFKWHYVLTYKVKNSVTGTVEDTTLSVSPEEIWGASSQDGGGDTPHE